MYLAESIGFQPKPHDFVVRSEGAENMQAFSTPSVSHGKDRCFTEANGAFQAGLNERRRAHYIREGEPGELRMPGKAVLISMQSVGLLRAERGEPGV
jgi:hypothetical protein